MAAKTAASWSDGVKAQPACHLPTPPDTPSTNSARSAEISSAAKCRPGRRALSNHAKHLPLVPGPGTTAKLEAAKRSGGGGGMLSGQRTGKPLGLQEAGGVQQDKELFRAAHRWRPPVLVPRRTWHF